MISKTFLEKFYGKITANGRDLIVEFFITFSRFECALKATIEYASGNETRVNPNWDSFIGSIRNEFNPMRTPKLQEAVRFILENPPKIQSLSGDNITWRNREFNENTPDIFKLSLHVRDIRNNLFHGGKFNGNYQADISRNYKLINSALTILNEWLLIKPNVKSNFLIEIE